MFHSFKKHAFLLQAPLRPSLTPTSEYLHLRHQLRLIRTSLQHLLSVHQAAATIWLRLLHNQRNFSERIHLAYPNHDSLSSICADFRNQTTHLSDQFAREQRPVSPILAHIRTQIQLYVDQIITIEAKYSALDASHAEYNRYKNKVDSLVTRTSTARFSPRRVPGEDRKTRNFGKMDHAQELHSRLLAEMLQRQRKLFFVHTALFRAALVAFWISHANCVDTLVHSLEQAKTFAQNETESIKQLDVRALIESADGEIPVSLQTEAKSLPMSDTPKHASPTSSTVPHPVPELNQNLEATRALARSSPSSAASDTSSLHTAIDEEQPRDISQPIPDAVEAPVDSLHNPSEKEHRLPIQTIVDDLGDQIISPVGIHQTSEVPLVTFHKKQTHTQNDAHEAEPPLTSA